MISVNQFEREKYGLFSYRGLRATFFLPEIYFAGSIGDFCREKNQVKETGWSPFQPKKYCHQYSKSVIFFSSCYFRKTAEPDHIAIEKKFKEFFENMGRRIRSENPPPKIDEEVKEFGKRHLQRLNNGELYDAGQFSLPILFSGEVPEKKRLYNVEVLYQTKYDCCELVDYSDHLDYGQSEKEAERFSLADLVKGLLPQPA